MLVRVWSQPSQHVTCDSELYDLTWCLNWLNPLLIYKSQLHKAFKARSSASTVQTTTLNNRVYQSKTNFLNKKNHDMCIQPLCLRAKVHVLTPDCRANISTSSTPHLVTRQSPVAVSLRGNNNKRLLQYHYEHFGCLPATLRITLHGRQIGNWNTSVMEANCLSAGLVCISCKFRVHSSETWLTNNSHSEAKKVIENGALTQLFTSHSLIIAQKHWWPHSSS